MIDKLDWEKTTWIKAIDKINEIIDHLPQEKEYCQCKEKPVRLISHCRNCGKAIENPPTIKEMLEEQPAKEVPDIVEMVRAIHKIKLPMSGTLGLMESKIIAQAISALYRKDV